MMISLDLIDIRKEKYIPKMNDLDLYAGDYEKIRKDCERRMKMYRITDVDDCINKGYFPSIEDIEEDIIKLSEIKKVDYNRPFNLTSKFKLGNVTKEQFTQSIDFSDGKVPDECFHSLTNRKTFEEFYFPPCVITHNGQYFIPQTTDKINDSIKIVWLFIISDNLINEINRKLKMKNILIKRKIIKCKYYKLSSSGIRVKLLITKLMPNEDFPK